MKKILILILLLLSPIVRGGELEVASEIIGHIAVAITSTQHRPIKVYARNLYERQIITVSMGMILTTQCKEADFLLLSSDRYIPDECQEKIIFFTRYKPFSRNKQGVGAFFWQKGRVNILFLKERLKHFKITLPEKWEQFIETDL